MKCDETDGACTVYERRRKCVRGLNLRTSKKQFTWRLGKIIWLCNTKLCISVQVKRAVVFHMMAVFCVLHRVVKSCKVRRFGGTYCILFQGHWIGPSKWWITKLNEPFKPPPKKNTFTLPTYVVKPLRNNSCLFVFEQRGCWTAHRRKINTSGRNILVGTDSASFGQL